MMDVFALDEQSVDRLKAQTRQRLAERRGESVESLRRCVCVCARARVCVALCLSSRCSLELSCLCPGPSVCVCL